MHKNKNFKNRFRTGPRMERVLEQQDTGGMSRKKHIKTKVKSLP